MITRCDLVPQYLALEEEINRTIAGVLRSGRYVLAEEVRQFEEEFAAYLGVHHAVGTANGTDALTLALRALGVGAGDEVITTSFTAIPTASAILAAGATPIFAEIDPDTYLLSADHAVSLLSERTRAIVPVHIFGNVVDIPTLRSRLPDGVWIVEDACQAHGSTIRDIRAGTMGDAAAFSFYPTKNLGGYGDGGAVVTRDNALAERVRKLRMYGMIDKDHAATPGINSRLDEIQAAILRIKLRHLETYNERRRALAARYDQELTSCGLRPQRVAPEVSANNHVYAARVPSGRDELAAFLHVRGIQTNVYYPIPLYRQGFLRDRVPADLQLECVEAVCREIIALPMYPELDAAAVDEVLRAVRDHHEEVTLFAARKDDK